MWEGHALARSTWKGFPQNLCKGPQNHTLSPWMQLLQVCFMLLVFLPQAEERLRIHSPVISTLSSGHRIGCACLSSENFCECWAIYLLQGRTSFQALFRLAIHFQMRWWKSLLGKLSRREKVLKCALPLAIDCKVALAGILSLQ